jgi:hypothetical protein
MITCCVFRDFVVDDDVISLRSSASPSDASYSDWSNHHGSDREGNDEESSDDDPYLVKVKQERKEDHKKSPKSISKKRKLDESLSEEEEVRIVKNHKHVKEKRSRIIESSESDNSS